ncbi:MAG: leucine-rich repeat protein, partial [Treponema sp.]|nr:leucine-rich repeat protein [Treponema sp.]
SFEHCISLKSIRIPKNVVKINPCAFQDSENLSSIEFDGTVEQWNKMPKCPDWDDKVPAKVVHCTDGDAEK